MSRSFSDSVTGWSLECDTDASGAKPPPGGMVLRNVRHRSNNFARDIRLVAVRLKIAELEPSGGATLATKNLLVTLDPATFTFSDIQELTPSTAIAPAVAGAGGRFLDRLKAAADQMLLLKSHFADSSGNYSGYGLRADYSSTAKLLEGFGNCEIKGLTISQIFLFTSYGNSPPHEPSTALMAARCHPMTAYVMLPNSEVDHSKPFQRVESIRFDYRVHFTVDSVPATGTTAAPTPKSNNAGLFRDNDSAAVGKALVTGVGGFIVGGPVGALASQPMATSQAAFAAVEKPLELEVTAPGLATGLSKYSDSEGEHWCWDNVHWWGTRGSPVMVSTPGAFHCAHMHWRWGGAALPSGLPTIDTSGRPKALSENTTIADAAKGTVLVDPRIWIQTINVAVTEDDPVIDPDRSGVTSAKLCTETWKSAFTGLRSGPRGIRSGTDIVCWYSAEVHGEYEAPTYQTGHVFKTTHARVRYTSKPEGAVFLHGIFFAHEAEKSGLKVGSTAPLYWPKSDSTIKAEDKWVRDANS
jgi:hypothetical protein